MAPKPIKAKETAESKAKAKAETKANAGAKRKRDDDMAASGDDSDGDAGAVIRRLPNPAIVAATRLEKKLAVCAKPTVHFSVDDPERVRRATAWLAESSLLNQQQTAIDIGWAGNVFPLWFKQQCTQGSTKPARITPLRLKNMVSFLHLPEQQSILGHWSEKDDVPTAAAAAPGDALRPAAAAAALRRPNRPAAAPAAAAASSASSIDIDDDDMDDDFSAKVVDADEDGDDDDAQFVVRERASAKPAKKVAKPANAAKSDEVVYVYVMSDHFDVGEPPELKLKLKRFKVGWAKNAQSRLRDLQIGNPSLRLIATFPVKSVKASTGRDAEQHVHKVLEQTYKIGTFREWCSKPMLLERLLEAVEYAMSNFVQ